MQTCTVGCGVPPPEMAGGTSIDLDDKNSQKISSHNLTTTHVQQLAMGVSLERVQFKFASIIGELCSEPLVLSQFAVWLDLRLAEYKSKGCISLDCCGMLPEPDWLKGLKVTTPVQPEPSSSSDQTLSGDLGDSFFSLSKETSSSQEFTNMRHSFPSQESRRPITNHHRHHNHHERESQLQNNYHRSESFEGVASPDVVVVPEDDDVTPITGPIRNAHRDPTSMLSSSASSYSDQSQPIDPHLRRNYPASLSSFKPSQRFSPYKNISPNDNESRKRNSTERNIAAAVSSFQRWLMEAPRHDQRDITDIPAAALDSYLALFFSTVKKPSGEDYTRRSFSVYRYSLDRYLKEHNYPLSICRSEEFSKSQQAFQQRKLSLPEVATDQYRQISNQYPQFLSMLSEKSSPSNAKASPNPPSNVCSPSTVSLPGNTPPSHSQVCSVPDVMDITREAEERTEVDRNVTTENRVENQTADHHGENKTEDGPGFTGIGGSDNHEHYKSNELQQAEGSNNVTIKSESSQSESKIDDSASTGQLADSDSKTSPLLQLSSDLNL